MSNPFLRNLINGTAEPEAWAFHAFLDRVMQGSAARQEVIAFLAGLSARPLAAACVVHFLSYVQGLSPPAPLAGGEDAVNICGTGGGLATFNISTAAAFLASAAGARVLKSGSSAYSSRCGSLDVLRALRVPTPDDPALLAEMLATLGIGFVPASHYTPLLRRMAGMVVPLAFRDLAGFINTIGPLLCPYWVSAQLVGVGRAGHLDVVEEALRRLGCSKTLLVHAEIGLDELVSLGANDCRLIDGDIRRFTLHPHQFQFAGGALGELAGGTVDDNAAILRAVLAGGRRGAARDTVLLNSGVLLYLGGLCPNIERGVARAAEVLDQGEGLAQLERVVAWGQRHAPQRVSKAAA